MKGELERRAGPDYAGSGDVDTTLTLSGTTFTHEEIRFSTFEYGGQISNTDTTISFSISAYFIDGVEKNQEILALILAAGDYDFLPIEPDSTCTYVVDENSLEITHVDDSEVASVYTFNRAE